MDMKQGLCHVNLARGFRGGERQTELLVRELSARGIAQDIVLRAGEPLVERLADVPGLSQLQISKPFTRYARRMRGTFIHAHDGKGAHFAHMAHLLSGCDYLITRRVTNHPSSNWVTRRMYRKAKSVAVLSDAIGSTMQTYLPALSPVRIPSATGGLSVDPERAAALRRKYGGECIVVQVGALDSQLKGQSDLIAAAYRLLAEDAGWRFVFVGSGPDEEALRKAAASSEAIHFAGQVENVGDYLAASDLFAFPSVHEGLGSTLLDAMHAELPIVASHVGGIPELVIDDRTGLLVPPHNPEALSAALSKLRREPELARRLAEAGKARLSDYSASAMANRYLALYREIGLSLERYIASDDVEMAGENGL